MAANVVSCPSCGKKYKIPADRDIAGFKCTGCGETVEMGGEAPARGGGGGGRRRAGRSARRRPTQDKSNQNTGVYIALGGIALVAVIIVIAVMVSGGGDDGDRGEAEVADIDGVVDEPTKPADEPTKPVRPEPRDPNPMPDTPSALDPAPRPGPTDRPGPRDPDPRVADEPDEADETDIRMMSWDKVSERLAALGHLDSTSASLRAEIDAAVALVVDDTSGGDGLRAKIQLVRIGKPAVPLLLRAMSGKTFTTREERSAAYMVDEAFREITNYTRQLRLDPHLEKPEIFQRVLKYHLIWWNGHKDLEGADFKEKSITDDDDEDW